MRKNQDGDILTESASCNGRNFFDLVGQTSKNSLLCVGLDSAFKKLPASVLARAKDHIERHTEVYSAHEKEQGVVEQAIFLFNCEIIRAVAPFAGAFKLNLGFYGRYGDAGNSALKKTIAFIKEYYPHMPIILDGKRGDIDNSNEEYAAEQFEEFDGDAATTNPYFGGLTMGPFFKNANKGIIVLDRTSNKGSEEFQDLLVLPPGETDITKCMPLYLYVAIRFCKEWNTRGNCALVVGATYPEQLKAVREAVGNMLLLIPGVGKQGGDLEKTVRYGLNAEGAGMLINASRSIIFASTGDDFAQAAAAEAERMNSEINAYRIQFSQKAAAGSA